MHRPKDTMIHRYSAELQIVFLYVHTLQLSSLCSVSIRFTNCWQCRLQCVGPEDKSSNCHHMVLHSLVQVIRVGQAQSQRYEDSQVPRSTPNCIIPDSQGLLYLHPLSLPSCCIVSIRLKNCIHRLLQRVGPEDKSSHWRTHYLSLHVHVIRVGQGQSQRFDDSQVQSRIPNCITSCSQGIFYMHTQPHTSSLIVPIRLKHCILCRLQGVGNRTRV